MYGAFCVGDSSAAAPQWNAILTPSSRRKQEQPHGADRHADELARADRLTEQAVPDEQQHDGKADIRRERAAADLPARAVEEDVARLQSHDGKAEDERRPIHSFPRLIQPCCCTKLFVDTIRQIENG